MLPDHKKAFYPFFAGALRSKNDLFVYIFVVCSQSFIDKVSGGLIIPVSKNRRL
jgi:hypothetical protein